MRARTASEYFGGMAAAYDSLIRRAVPRYDEMIERLVDYLPASAERVLELGCGTGNFTLALARRYPDASLTLVDASPEMLALARSRLEAASAGSAARATYVESRFEDLAPRAGAFDLAASCISLHHVVDKAALYRALHLGLVPGGALRFSDQIGGSTAANHERNWERWLEHCRAPGHCTEEEVRSLLDHAAAHDHYTPLDEIFRLLAAAGFRSLDCTWRNWIWGIVTAER
jgi:ubiquinone/menaquinone biosynthesis C-methylase UbiE